MGDKIVFLDIHGVLVPMTNDSAGYSPQCIAAFNRIVEVTGAEIVLSCSWRTAMAGHLVVEGIAGNVIGRTRDELSDDEPRWRQIADWLKENRAPSGRRRYCILDDDPDAFGKRPGVLVNGGVGLTESDADLAIEILNS